MEIKIISTEETFPLRIEILRKGIARDFHFVGDDDKGTFHIGAFSDNECVGIASCMLKSHTLFTSKKVYQLRGMAIKKDIQNSGVGKEIILKTVEILENKNCKTVWCNARESALGFYEKMGFRIIGERFQIPKVGPHFVMYKNLE